MAILSSDLIRQGAAGASTGYTIDNSLRFNPGDSPEISRTHGAGGNVDKSTISFWFKRSNTTTQIANDEMHIFGSGSSVYSTFDIQFTKTDQIHVWDYQSAYITRLQTNRLFRDLSAWYHLVFIYDSGNTIASDRARLYINGQRESSFSEETYPSQNQDAILGTNVAIGFGNYISYGSKYYSGYLAEAHYVNGYAYGPEYFGELDSNGIWIPKEYSESYGTGGFYLEFKDSSALGADTSGQGNNLTTVQNLATNDQVEDTPTNNKITFNPLNNQRSGGTPRNGALDYVGPGTRTMISTTGGPFPSTGKWAVAIKAAQVSTDAGWSYGLQKVWDQDMTDAAGSNEDIGSGSDGANFSPFSSDGYTYNFSTSTATDPSLPLATADEFWLAVDIATGKYWFGIYDASASGYKWIATDGGLDGDPGAGSNETGTLSELVGNTGQYEFIFSSKQTSQHIYLQREADLAGAIPTGFTYWENVRDLV